MSLMDSLVSRISELQKDICHEIMSISLVGSIKGRLIIYFYRQLAPNLFGWLILKFPPSNTQGAESSMADRASKFLVWQKEISIKTNTQS